MSKRFIVMMLALLVSVASLSAAEANDVRSVEDMVRGRASAKGALRRIEAGTTWAAERDRERLQRPHLIFIISPRSSSTGRASTATHGAARGCAAIARR